MPITAGAISLVSKGQTIASLSATVATGGTAPYTYQWYRSVTTGFSPGGGNIISGATLTTLSDSGLIPNTTYYYKVIATDSAGSPASVTYSQLAVATDLPSPVPNQFTIAPFLGMTDMRMNTNTVAVQIDASEAGTSYAGQAVKIYDSAGGVPKVVKCSANSDDVFGFINFDIKSKSYVAGDKCEISQSGNVIYLYATAAIARGAQVQLDISTPGGVAPKTGSSGADLVGYAFDKATVAGDLIRVRLASPSFLKA